MPFIFGMVDPTKGMQKVVPYDQMVAQRPNVSNYTFTGPSTGSNGVATAPFQVQLPVGVSLPQPVTITPADASSGTFTPTTVRLTDVDRAATFTYTFVGTGAKTISVTNDRGLTNPASIVCTIS